MSNFMNLSTAIGAITGSIADQKTSILENTKVGILLALKSGRMQILENGSARCQTIRDSKESKQSKAIAATVLEALRKLGTIAVFKGTEEAREAKALELLASFGTDILASWPEVIVKSEDEKKAEKIASDEKKAKVLNDAVDAEIKARNLAPVQASRAMNIADIKDFLEKSTVKDLREVMALIAPIIANDDKKAMEKIEREAVAIANASKMQARIVADKIASDKEIALRALTIEANDAKENQAIAKAKKAGKKVTA